MEYKGKTDLRLCEVIFQSCKSCNLAQKDFDFLFPMVAPPWKAALTNRRRFVFEAWDTRCYEIRR